MTKLVERAKGKKLASGNIKTTILSSVEGQALLKQLSAEYHLT